MIDDHEPPRDPDWDHVPRELARLHGRPVTVRMTPDGETETGTLAVPVGMFGELHRRRTGLYDEGGDDAA